MKILRQIKDKAAEEWRVVLRLTTWKKEKIMKIKHSTPLYSQCCNRITATNSFLTKDSNNLTDLTNIAEISITKITKEIKQNIISISDYLKKRSI